MKILPFIVPKMIDSSFLVQIDDQPYFYDILHKHHDFQLTLIIESDGTALIGDYVGNFKPGDVFLIASNVPHVFKNDKCYYEKNSEKRAYGISIFFEKNLFGESFLDLPETQDLGKFLEKHQSLKVNPITAKKLEPKIKSIGESTTLDRIVDFLLIFKILVKSTNNEVLTSEVIHSFTESQAKRISKIYEFTLNEFQRNITLEEVASVAHMTVQSFCRYFKKRTRKTYVQFLTEMRVSYACKQLQQEDLTITNICHMAGFNNLSNFNRKFKEVMGLTPSAYRKINTTF